MRYLAQAMLLAIICCTAAASQVDVQGVEGSNKTKDGVPATLSTYKKLLGDTEFSCFKDLGKQSVKGSAGGTGSLSVGRYTVDVEVKSVDGNKGAVAVTIKDSGKAIATPTQYSLSKGESQSFQLPGGDKSAKIIVILTLHD